MVIGWELKMRTISGTVEQFETVTESGIEGTTLWLKQAELMGKLHEQKRFYCSYRQGCRKTFSQTLKS